MRRISTLAITGLFCTAPALPQGRPVDWPGFGGDPQRSGWEKSDSRITKDNVKDFQMVLKQKLAAAAAGTHSLTPPVVIGQLISYRGFKELAFVAGAGDHIWSLDADVERMFWEKRLTSSAAKSRNATCAGMVTAMPSLTPPVTFGGRPRPTPASPGANPGGAARPTTPPSTVPGAESAGPKPILGSTSFGAPRPLFAVTSDGKLHVINTSTGDDQMPGIDFLPAGSKASPLAIADNTIYTTTSSGCEGSTNGVWALNLSTATPQLAKFDLKDKPLGLGGLAVSSAGTVYVQTASALLSFSSKDLKQKQSFTPQEGAGSTATPAVFGNKNQEIVVSAGKDGRLYLLDGETLAPLSHTVPLTSGGTGVWGGISTWQSQDGKRYVLAPVWGALSAELKPIATNGDVTHGAIVAFEFEEKDGKQVLTPTWVSHDMVSPEPPVLTGGMAFTVAAGNGSTPAVFSALDALTGKEVFNSGKQVTAPAQHTGLTLANARIYFTTTDNTLYAFGVFLER